MLQQNPYTPPASGQDVPDAPRAHGWKLKGRRVLVVLGAVLPMVDPYSGRTADRMILHRVEVKRRPVWIRWVALGSLVLLALAVELARRGLGFTPVAVLAGAGLLASCLAALLGGSIYLRVFCTAQTLRRMRAAVVLDAVALFGVIGSLGMLLLSDPGVWWKPLLAPLLAVSSVLWAVSFLLLRRLVCRRRIGSLFEIQGFHPAALRQLEEVNGQLRFRQEMGEIAIPLAQGSSSS